jgi:hypothetical protein
MEKQFKLPTEFTLKWLEALRSGEYKQGKGYLYNSVDNTYCCLGVAGVVCGMDKDKLDEYNGFGNFGNGIMPNENVPKQLITDYDDNTQLVYHLTGRNDGLKSLNNNPTGDMLTFAEIADWIENNVELI